MRELQTQYRDISATSPISVCRGITPLCAPIPQKEDFASEVGGRYSDRVYSLWQRLNLFFLEESTDPVVQEKHVTLVNNFTQQLFLQLFSNKNTSRLIRSDPTYSAISHSLQKGDRAVDARRSATAATKDMVRALQEKSFLTGDLCGLASVLKGDLGGDGKTVPTEQTLLLAVDRLVKVISEEKAISTQNRVLLERIRSVAYVDHEGEQTPKYRNFTTAMGELLRISPEADATQLEAGCQQVLGETAFAHTRAREEYAGAVERILRMVREGKEISEIHETVNNVTNRMYERRIAAMGHGKDYVDTAKRVREVLEAMTIPSAHVTQSPSDKAESQSEINHANGTHAPEKFGVEDIIQLLSTRTGGLEGNEIQQALLQGRILPPAESNANGADRRISGIGSGVVTAESLKMDRAVKAAEAAVLQMLREPPTAGGAFRTGLGGYAESMSPLQLTYGEDAAPTVSDAPTQHPVERGSDRIVDRVAEQVADRVMDRTVDQTVDRVTGRVMERTGLGGYAESMPPLQLTYGEDAAPTVSEALTQRPVERGSDRIVDRVAEQVTDRVMDRTVDQTVDRVTDRVMDRFGLRLEGHISDTEEMTRYNLSSRTDMVRQLYSRTQRYLADRTILESRHRRENAQSGNALSESPLLRMNAAMTSQGSIDPIAMTPMAAYADSHEVSAIGPREDTARIRAFDGFPLYLQHTDNIYFYTTDNTLGGANGAPLTGQSLARDQRPTQGRMSGRMIPESDSIRSAEKRAEHTAELVADRLTDRLTENLTESVAEHLTERTLERLSEQTTERLTERLTEQLVEPLAEQVDIRPEGHISQTERQIRHILSQKTDMVQELHRRTRRYLADSVAFENGHGIGYLGSDNAPSESFLPLLAASSPRHAGVMPVSGMSPLLRTDGYGVRFDAASNTYVYNTELLTLARRPVDGESPAGVVEYANGNADHPASIVSGDNVVHNVSTTSIEDTVNMANTENRTAHIRPFNGSPVYLQNTDHFYYYTLGAPSADGESSAGTVGPLGMVSAQGRVRGSVPPVSGEMPASAKGRVIPSVSGYGSTLRLVMPEASAEKSNTEVREGRSANRPNSSYRKDLDEMTLRALDGIIAQAQGTAPNRSATPDGTVRRGMARVERIPAEPEAEMYYAEPSAEVPDSVGQGGITVLRPRRSSVISDVSEMRILLRQLDTTAQIKKFSSKTVTYAPHIAKLIHQVESGEGTTASGNAERPTTLSGNVTFRTVDDGENMIMLVPPVSADNLRAESGQLRDLPPITYREPHREEAPTSQPTEDKVTLNQKMESTKTVKAQVTNGFADMSREDIAKLADKVYAQLESRLMRERRRSGF